MYSSSHFCAARAGHKKKIIYTLANLFEHGAEKSERENNTIRSWLRASVCARRRSCSLFLCAFALSGILDARLRGWSIHSEGADFVRPWSKTAREDYYMKWLMNEREEEMYDINKGRRQYKVLRRTLLQLAYILH